jgi:hypothetical protein
MMSGGPNTKGGHGVKIEAQFAVGEYEILILSAQESNGLETWLREHKYTIPTGAADALAPYVRSQMKFFVAKVDIAKVHKNEKGIVQLSPLRMTYESSEVRLPVRLGLLNADKKQDLIVYLLHPSSRFEAANYANVFVPTNLEVVDAVRKDFASFYAELFDATLAARQGKAIVTEYAWQTTSCDPCPTEPLSATDLATLGGDPGKAEPGGWGGPSYASWVLTRLHARYDKSSLTDDLLFKEAKPVMGGRAEWTGKSADAGASPSEVNNFQGRYIIRHYWDKKVACSTPQYDRWGGPPGSDVPNYRPSPSAAKDVAFVPRGKVSLKDSVRSPVPTLGLVGHAPPRHP